MSNYTVSLVGPAPWGFRLQGGKDFNMPLTISRLSEGGKAAQASIEVGDVVLSIDGVSAEGMAHLAAQNMIKACTGSLKLILQRATPAPKPTATTVQKDESREHTIPVASIAPMALKAPPAASSAYNKTARPFGATSSPRVSPAPFVPASSPLTQPPPPSLAFTVHPSPTPQSASPQHVHASVKVGTNGRSPPVTAAKSPVTSSVNVPRQPRAYNTPINLYSSDNAFEVAEGQKRGLRDGQSDAKPQNGSPRRIVTGPHPDIHHQFSDQSKKRLMQDTEDWQPKTGTAQSRSFSILAQMTGTEHSVMPVSETNKKTRKICLDNPLDALPKSAPHPPPVRCDPKANTYVASLSAVKISKARFIEGMNMEVSVMPSGPPRATGDKPHSVDSGKHSVAVQTCDVLDEPCPAPASVRDTDPTVIISPVSKRTIVGSPLEGLPKAAPRVPVVKQSPLAKIAASTITAVLAAQARLSDPVVSRSLLDALLITPIIKPPPAHSKQPKRLSTSSLCTQKDKSGEHPEVLQPIGPATASVKPMSKPSGVCHTSPAAAGSGPTFKPSGVPGAAKTTVWQPGNSAVNSISKTTLPTAHVSPANSTSNAKVPSTMVDKPPQQDDNTLVQMAEHIPAGNRTPMCAHCNLVIRGPFLVAMGRSWHPEEFTCAYCSLSLAHIGFVEEKGSVYCEKCYEQFFAPDCARCQRKILGEIINALKQTWHVNCFVCVACMQPIRNNVFHMEDGEPYCEKDYYNLFGTSCHGCDFPIEAGDKFLQALGHTWHDTCFVCAVCCTNLEGQTFFSKKDKLLCKKHAHTVNV
ncbi:PDZ and LIM domain protein 5-like isoform X8 [Mobula birostris]|uniref:PDZ and LIM domain protein 5-like isoform X8 n=1 Tax=Mobula birostris TaxID=1983395 RepID=UPI003B27BC89